MPTSQKTLATQAYQNRRRRPGRRLKAILRHSEIIFREFWGIVLAFLITVVISALVFRFVWNNLSPHPNLRPIDALYFVTTLMLFEPAIDFPPEWYLEVFFFLMPVLGLIYLTLGVADFAQLLFQRNTREKEWEDALASTYDNHIIVAGLGHLGIRVVRELVILDEDIVVIELDTDNPRRTEVHNYDIPVITGDARTAEVLERAGIARASAMIIATNNDLINLQIASRVRELDQDVRLVMRMFDDQFAGDMADRFDVAAIMSASLMAAPAFAGAATATEIVQTFKVAEQVLVMGRVVVLEGSRLDGAHISDIEHALDVNIVLLQSGEMVDIHPQPGAHLKAGDTIAVVAELTKIKVLANEWNRPPKR